MPTHVNHADLWGINPQTGQLYTGEERGQAMRSRTTDPNMRFTLGRSQATSSPTWNRWFDRVNQARGIAGGFPEEAVSQPGGILSYTGGKWTPAVEALNRAIMEGASGGGSGFAGSFGLKPPPLAAELGTNEEQLQQDLQTATSGGEISHRIGGPGRSYLPSTRARIVDAMKRTLKNPRG